MSNQPAAASVLEAAGMLALISAAQTAVSSSPHCCAAHGRRRPIRTAEEGICRCLHSWQPLSCSLCCSRCGLSNLRTSPPPPPRLVLESKFTANTFSHSPQPTPNVVVSVQDQGEEGADPQLPALHPSMAARDGSGSSSSHTAAPGGDATAAPTDSALAALTSHEASMASLRARMRDRRRAPTAAPAAAAAATAAPAAAAAASISAASASTGIGAGPQAGGDHGADASPPVVPPAAGSFAQPPSSAAATTDSGSGSGSNPAAAAAAPAADSDAAAPIRPSLSARDQLRLEAALAALLLQLAPSVRAGSGAGGGAPASTLLPTSIPASSLPAHIVAKDPSLAVRKGLGNT